MPGPTALCTGGRESESGGRERCPSWTRARPRAGKAQSDPGGPGKTSALETSDQDTIKALLEVTLKVRRDGKPQMD